MVILRKYRVNGYDNFEEFLKLFYKFDKKLRFRISKTCYDAPWDGWYEVISYYSPSYKDYILNDNFQNLYHLPKKIRKESMMPEGTSEDIIASAWDSSWSRTYAWSSNHVGL